MEDSDMEAEPTREQKLLEDIEDKFDKFKEAHPDMDDVDIHIIDGLDAISFNGKNGGSCMTIAVDIHTKRIIIEEVAHCGSNISLILQFVNQIAVDNNITNLTITDASHVNFIMVDETHNSHTKRCSLLKLYTLAEGYSWYGKYLPHLYRGTSKMYHNLSTDFFDKFDGFNEKELQLIRSESKRTLGDFFTHMREWLKTHSVSDEDGYKIVQLEDWDKLVTFIDIMNKTWDICKSMTAEALLTKINGRGRIKKKSRGRKSTGRKSTGRKSTGRNKRNRKKRTIKYI